MFSSEQKKAAAAQLFVIASMSCVLGLFIAQMIENAARNHGQNWLQMVALPILLAAIVLNFRSVLQKVT